MSVSNTSIIWNILHTKSGRAGIAILAFLVSISIGVLVSTPVDTLREWNDPNAWLDRPKSAVPAWVNAISFSESIPEHTILDGIPVDGVEFDGVYTAMQSFAIKYHYDDFPSDIIYEYDLSYTGAPLLNIKVKRPDGMDMMLYSDSIPHSDIPTEHTERIFSADQGIKSNLQMYRDVFAFSLDEISAESIVFSKTDRHEPLHGTYYITASLYNAPHTANITDSTLIVGGKAYGLLGTDDLRRDLVIGIAWGTPLALFIGITVAGGSVGMGLLYGVYAGYHGKYIDESMMRFNDVIYALPALPFLIILSVTISNSIFVMVLFLMAFGWVGVAKVARSMALQIKTQSYVEASRMIGRKDIGIIIHHMLPQLLPYAFASVAISVPAAITTEAGLSFLGLGDPSFPTWGQILHDAGTYGAAARGMWWWIVPPGLMIAIAGLAFVFIGNSLDKISNPRMHR
ncbi:MAG: binding-protein-dependent transport system inner membrane protein [Cenarchaeum symbiont of Oopsacas minuta]|nr:binding-protein-dependent transport system inner membrane protein [Cenarchaeum symbiont of Oopsacas minuta]